MQGEQVSWFLELAVKPGEVDAARGLVSEMVESTQRESGALIYEWSISDDESLIQAYERYADSGAVVTHLSTFGEKFAQRLLAAVDPTGFVVYGDPTEQAREALSALGPKYMGRLEGFARL